MFLSWAPSHIKEDENFEKKKFPLDELKTDLKPFVVRYGAFAIPGAQWGGDGIIDFLIFKLREKLKPRQ